jgi:hypothetical protein
MFNVALLPDDLPGWQDVMSCPFCLNVAVDCIRLPHAEPEHDCGVCACADCVREWVVFCDNAELACPRCRYPICAVHLRDVCSRPNVRDPLVARLIADIGAQCPYCDLQGTVSTITSHTTKHCIERHLFTLHKVVAVIQQARKSSVSVSSGESIQCVDAFIALHALSPKEACHYLVQWMASIHQEGGQWADPYADPVRRLFLRLPIEVLDAYEMAWKNNAPPFSFGTVISMHKMVLDNEASMEASLYNATCSRLIDHIAEGFNSDNPLVLSDLTNSLPLSSIFDSIPVSVVGAFAERLLTMVEPPPTNMHSKLLICCIEEEIWDQPNATIWLSSVLKLSNLDVWWSDDLLAYCMYQCMIQGSPLFPMVEAFKGLWLLRHTKTHPMVYPSNWIAALLLAGMYQFDNRREVPDVFVILSMSSAPILEMMVPFMESIWMAFVCDISVRQTQTSEVDPLMMTPRLARALAHYTTTNQNGALNVQQADFYILDEHMPMILSKPNTVTNFSLALHMSSTISWLGHFTLFVALFNPDKLDCGLLADEFVKDILVHTICNCGWWADNTQSHDGVDWGWARIAVRLLAVLARPSNRVLCTEIANRVARQMGDMACFMNMTYRKWNQQVPIFTHPHDLGRLLWLLDDTVLLEFKVLPVFLMSHTGVIMNRLRFVLPQHWTASAATQVVESGAAKTITAVAWTAWFALTVPRDAQCAAVQAADAMTSKKPHTTQNRWVTLLHIQARIIRHRCPGPRADILIRFISDTTGTVNVEQLLDEWVVHPKKEVCVDMNRWAAAAHGHPLVDTPALFVLSQLRHALATFVPVPHQPPISLSTAGLSGSVGDYLVDQASCGCLVRARDALWFVVHYASDVVLISLANRWASNLRNHLVNLCVDDLDYDPMFETNSFLEKRCGMMVPSNEALDCLRLGLRMVMTHDIEPASPILSSDQHWAIDLNIASIMKIS